MKAKATRGEGESTVLNESIRARKEALNLVPAQPDYARAEALSQAIAYHKSFGGTGLGDIVETAESFHDFLTGK